MNEWKCEGISELINELMNKKRMNEWMNELMNEWMNEWMNELPIRNIFINFWGVGEGEHILENWTKYA